MNSTTARSGAAWLLEPLGTVLDADGAGWWYLWRVAVPTLVVSYLSLVRLLRYRAARRIQTKYAAYAADPYKLDYKQAREIMRGVFLYDMPFLFGFGTQWALIKSFGIASGRTTPPGQRWVELTVPGSERSLAIRSPLLS